MKNIISWSVGIIVLLFLMLYLTTPTIKESKINNAPTAENLNDKNILDTADFDKPELIIGNSDAPAILVEYGDFKCPSCNKFHHQAGAQLREEYVKDGRLKIEFRNYPFIGPDSGRAARGTYCANDQGVFTEFHDKVYNYMWDNFYESNNLAAEIEDVLTVDKLLDIMKSDIKDIDSFKDCLESDKYNPFIDASILQAAEDEVTGTPGFTIAGQKISGPQGYSTFKTLVEIELQ